MGAISLVSSPPTTSPEIYNDLATFGFNFLILISTWLRYTRIMSVLPLESRRIINLNVILLFLVSIEPFLFNLVRRPPVVADLESYADTTSTLYAADLGLVMVILGLFTSILADEEKKLVPKDMVRRFRLESLSWFISGAFFLISALPIFFTLYIGNSDNPVRYYLWAAPLVLVWGWRTYERMQAPDAGPDGDYSG